jgi:hypothetical protein
VSRFWCKLEGRWWRSNLCSLSECRKRRSLFISDQVGQSAVCLGTEPRLGLMNGCWLFLNFALWNLLGVIPAGTTELLLYFFTDVETFTVIIILLLLSNINVFSLLRPIPHFQKLHPVPLSTRQEVWYKQEKESFHHSTFGQPSRLLGFEPPLGLMTKCLLLMTFAFFVTLFLLRRLCRDDWSAFFPLLFFSFFFIVLFLYLLFCV